MIQPAYERITTPIAVPGERFVKVTDASGRSISMRTQCMGPGYTNSSLNVTDTVVLIEVGGGSSAIDMIGIQSNLSHTYSVCAYDRAGYGKSEAASAPETKNKTMELMRQTMEAVGFPIN